MMHLPIAPEWGVLHARPIPEVPKRMQHDAAHGLLRDTLPEYGALQGVRIPDTVPELSFGKNGKPSLTYYPEIRFNLSHCDGLAVCLYSPYECGADCEGIRKYRPRTAQRVCAPEELAALENAEDTDFLFTRLWTLKEAYVKAIGIGISYPLREVAFTFEGDRIIASKQDASFMQFLLKTHIVSVCILRKMPEQRIIQIP